MTPRVRWSPIRWHPRPKRAAARAASKRTALSVGGCGQQPGCAMDLCVDSPAIGEDRAHHLCIAVTRRLKSPEPSLQRLLDVERCAGGNDDVEVTPAIEQRRVGHRSVGFDVGARKRICHGGQ